MNIFKAIICKIKGHDIERDDDILQLVSYMTDDDRNWICKCRRCGRYILHDGAGSGMTVAISKKEAYRMREYYERDVLEMIKWKLENKI